MYYFLFINIYYFLLFIQQNLDYPNPLLLSECQYASTDVSEIPNALLSSQYAYTYIIHSNKCMQYVRTMYEYNSISMQLCKCKDTFFSNKSLQQCINDN